jgi:hypothetical protein
VKLVTTYVVRGSQQGQSHGGVYLIDLERRSVRQAVDWNKGDIDWRGRGWDRGLRGIAVDRGLVYITGSDELFAFTPDFRPAGSWRNAYLKHCHEIAVYQRTLYLTSTGCDSILGFDLDAQEFRWAMHVASDQFRFKATVYDPRKQDGPLMLNKLHINSVHCTQGGMYITGMRTGGMLLFNGKHVQMAAQLPPGSHNARPFRDGVLFNDTRADVVRFASRASERVFPVPRYPAEQLTHVDLDDTKIARQAFGRGLCVVATDLIAGGSSPSTIALHDLGPGANGRIATLTYDVRNAIHGLEVWPYYNRLPG